MLDQQNKVHFYELMNKLSEKDNESWAALQFVLERAIKHWLKYKYSSSNAIDNEMIDEIFQDTMATLFEIITDEKKNEVYFEEFKNLKSYAIGVAKYKAYEAIRKSKRYYDILDSDEKETLIENAYQNDGVNFVDDMANKELVKKLLENLDGHERDILVRFSQGEKLNDIADTLGITAQNCRIIKFRTLKKLEAKLSELSASGSNHEK